MAIPTAVAAFYLPVTLMCLLYFRIYRETVKRRKELHLLQAQHHCSLSASSSDRLKKKLSSISNISTDSTRSRGKIYSIENSTKKNFILLNSNKQNKFFHSFNIFCYKR